MKTRNLLFCLLLCLIGTGAAFAQEETTVFSETFDTSESFSKFTVIDVAQDSETWLYYTIKNCARASVLFNTNDDYLITPVFSVTEGNTYKIYFSLCGKKAKMKLCYGSSATVEGMAEHTLMEETVFDGVEDTYCYEFVSDYTGDCYIGFHASSGEMLTSTLDIDDIIITETAKPQDDTPLLYGTIVGSDLDSFTAGIYSFTPTQEIELQAVYERTDMIANGGGFYCDDKYYCNYYMIYGADIFCAHHIYDFETGSLSTVLNVGKEYVASDAAYDPTTDLVYCCQMLNDNTFALSTIDRETGEKHPIAAMEHMAVIAIDADGKIYGISGDGILYEINKTDASLRYIGDTQLRGMGLLVQSGTIDPATGRFFWAMSTDNGSGLYEVNKETAETTLIGNFPNNERMSGLFTRSSYFAPEACDSVSGLNVEFAKADLQGLVTFAAPTVDLEGNSLSAPMDVKIYVDYQLQKELTAVEPGSLQSVPVSVDEEGWHVFVVTTSNEAGNGKAANERVYVGNDTPSPVTDVTLVNEGLNMHITWSPSTGGVNGGYIDEEALTYYVMRYPDYVIIADNLTTTEYTDVLQSDAMTTYSYGVVAQAHGKESEMIVSNFVTVGDEMAIPFMETFEIPQTFANWTIVDANNDGYTWRYSTELRAAIYEWSLSDDFADDWLISPPFTLEAGYEYHFSIDAVNSISNQIEKMEVFLGTDVTVESMTRPLIPLTDIDCAGEYIRLTESFKEETGGKYRIGVHVCSETHIGDLVVKNIGMEKGNSGIDVISDTDLLHITVVDGRLCVDNRTATAAAVYSIDGVCRANVQAGQYGEWDLPAGIYIVKSANSVHKVLVRK